ncbi:B3 DNA binding domain [Macleaya cordata]|uniref:B3 DNA binding domain n=1 Tax=Macleaya cordata TaxID=56857 RepID=A0A200QYA1_MACCD|nr:B3 DNA binding domain [Macleaya cordata]
MEGETSGTSSLMGPSGKVWNFTVNIYDPSECEKESAYNAVCSQDTTCSIRDKGKKRGISGEAVKVLNDSSYKTCEGLSKRKRGMEATVPSVSLHSAHKFTSSMNKCEKNQLEVHSNRLAVSKAANLEDSVNGNRRTLKYKLKKVSEKHHLDSATKHLLNDNRCRALISQRRNVTEGELERAIEAAMAFESKNPYTVMVMRVSHVYLGFFLAMPNSFRKSHLPKDNQRMILRDPSGRAWPVSYIGRKDKGALSGGWGTVVYHNNIEADDVCIFELITANEIQLHIFRVVEEITPLIKNTSRLKKPLGFGGKLGT